MTEKRFTLISVVNFDYGINDNDKPIGSLSNICDLLNELSDENEQLKKENERLKNWNKCLAENRHQELKSYKKWSDE